MRKYVIISVLSAGLLFGLFWRVSAQGESVLTAALDSQTPAAQNIQTGVPSVDVARITLTVSGSDVYLNGIYLATDVPGGLSNFTNLYIYDVTSTETFKGSYSSSNQGDNPNLVQIGTVILANGLPKTYLVRASLAYSAAGSVRVGFSGFTFATSNVPTLSGIPIYGNVMTLPGTVSTPTPSPTPSPTLSPIPTPTPTPTPTPLLTPTSRGFVSLAALNLTEGDTISAVGSADPDIYIANGYGYKRLFLNPVIFNFYGHLGGFGNVKKVTVATRDTLVTSGLFRNCETNDSKVYGLETTGEDAGMLHWVNTSGAQAVQDDPDFFKKVFCINTNEFSWYSKGSDFTSVNQVPNYSR